MTSSRTAAVPRPVPARRAPRLMLPAPCAAASRAPRGRGRAGGPGDDPQGRLLATARLQVRGPRARQLRVREAKRRAPPAHPRGPAPRQAPPRARGLVGVVVPRGGRGRGGANPVLPPLRLLGTGSSAANEEEPRGPQNKGGAGGGGGDDLSPRGSWKHGLASCVFVTDPRAPRPPSTYSILGSSTLSRRRFLRLTVLWPRPLRGPSKPLATCRRGFGPSISVADDILCPIPLPLPGKGTNPKVYTEMGLQLNRKTWSSGPTSKHSSLLCGFRQVT